MAGRKEKLVSRRDIEFLLFEILELQKLSKHPLFQPFNRKAVELIVKEARNLAIKELLPLNKEGDEQGCEFSGGTVKVPGCFHDAYAKVCDGDWIAPAEDPDFGGQGIPSTAALAASEYLTAANTSLMMYPGLTLGAGNMIYALGTDEQKKMYVEKLYTGKWAGTMLLTEPNAGSDVGSLETEAVPKGNGTFSLKGSKIFISGGEQDLTENIIHIVLARVSGAPEGTGGISCFIVPKYLVNPDGSLGAFNNISCTGIEEKMGIHGSSTCSLSMGDKGECRGFLVGQENKGMRVMFHMMNEARLWVGLQSLSIASAAYQEALKYADSRIQGRELKCFADRSKPGAPIIRHPDVRRMLLDIKATIEGARSLLYYTAYLMDLIKVEADADKAAGYQAFIDFLTPIAKGYVTDRVFYAVSEAMQVMGGYGYIKEYPIEQYLRDCRITMIYEGTNGIQAMDLLARKLGMNKGKTAMALLGEVQSVIDSAKKQGGLKAAAGYLEKAFQHYGAVALNLGGKAQSADFEKAFAQAHPFMMATGDLIMAWKLLERAVTAADKLAGKPKSGDALFYDGQIKTAEHFIYNRLSETMGRLSAIDIACGAVVEMDEKSF